MRRAMTDEEKKAASERLARGREAKKAKALDAAVPAIPTIRTIAEGFRSADDLIRTPTTLKGYGPDAFPGKHPDMECVLVPLAGKSGPGSAIHQYIQDDRWFRGEGYTVLSDDVDDTGRDDMIWMGKSKEKLARERALRNPDNWQKQITSKMDPREAMLNGVSFTTSKAMRMSEIEGALAGNDPTRVAEANAQALAENPEFERMLDSLAD